MTDEFNLDDIDEDALFAEMMGDDDDDALIAEIVKEETKELAAVSSEMAGEMASNSLKATIEANKRRVAEAKAKYVPRSTTKFFLFLRKEAEEMAQYAREEEENEKAAQAMKDRVERQKQSIAENKVCSFSH
jgi:hypothetical protein